MNLEEKVKILEDKVYYMDCQIKELKSTLDKKLKIFNRFINEQFQLEKKYNHASKCIIEETSLEMSLCDDTPILNQDENTENYDLFNRLDQDTFINTASSSNTKSTTKTTKKKNNLKRKMKLENNITDNDNINNFKNSKIITLQEEQEHEDSTNFDLILPDVSSENFENLNYIHYDNINDEDDDETNIDITEISDNYNLHLEKPEKKKYTKTKVTIIKSSSKGDDDILDLDSNYSTPKTKPKNKIWDIFRVEEAENNKKIVTCYGCHTTGISAKADRLRGHAKKCKQLQLFLKSKGIYLKEESY